MNTTQSIGNVRVTITDGAALCGSTNDHCVLHRSAASKPSMCGEMAAVLSVILPDFPPAIRRFRADTTHECDACGEHARCQTVTDEAFCEPCYRSLAADAGRGV